MKNTREIMNSKTCNYDLNGVVPSCHTPRQISLTCHQSPKKRSG